MQGLRKELTKKIDKIQVDLQGVKGDIMDTKNFYNAYPEKHEANPEEIESEAEHGEVPKE
jgi:hypothetical protein